MGEDVEIGKRPPSVVAGFEGLLDAASARREPHSRQHAAAHPGQLEQLFPIPAIRKNRQSSGQAFGNIPKDRLWLHGPLGSEIILGRRVDPHHTEYLALRRDFLGGIGWTLGGKFFSVSHAGCCLSELETGRKARAYWLPGDGVIPLEPREAMDSSLRMTIQLTTISPVPAAEMRELRLSRRRVMDSVTEQSKESIATSDFVPYATSSSCSSFGGRANVIFANRVM